MSAVSKIKTELRLITPAIAKDMLKRNFGNRRLNLRNVGFLCKEMKIGNWKFDGQPLRFTASHQLLDGQHRLEALIEADMSLEFLVITGVNPDAFTVMDTGKNRNSSDIFSIEGIENYSNVAAATRMICMTQNGKHADTYGAYKPSNTDLLDFYSENKSISKYVENADFLYRSFNRVISTSHIAAYGFLMAELNVQESEEFWKKVCTGVGIDEGCPTGALRSKLIADKMSLKKIPRNDKKGLIFKAWNFYRKGADVKFLRYNAQTEGVPELI